MRLFNILVLLCLSLPAISQSANIVADFGALSLAAASASNIRYGSPFYMMRTLVLASGEIKYDQTFFIDDPLRERFKMPITLDTYCIFKIEYGAPLSLSSGFPDTMNIPAESYALRAHVIPTSATVRDTSSYVHFDFSPYSSNDWTPHWGQGRVSTDKITANDGTVPSSAVLYDLDCSSRTIGSKNFVESVAVDLIKSSFGANLNIRYTK